jgi:hypothetical protein
MFAFGLSSTISKNTVEFLAETIPGLSEKTAAAAIGGAVRFGETWIGAAFKIILCVMSVGILVIVHFIKKRQFLSDSDGIKYYASLALANLISRRQPGTAGAAAQNSNSLTGKVIAAAAAANAGRYAEQLERKLSSYGRNFQACRCRFFGLILENLYGDIPSLASNLNDSDSMSVLHDLQKFTTATGVDDEEHAVEAFRALEMSIAKLSPRMHSESRRGQIVEWFASEGIFYASKEMERLEAGIIFKKPDAAGMYIGRLMSFAKLYDLSLHIGSLGSGSSATYALCPVAEQISHLIEALEVYRRSPSASTEETAAFKDIDDFFRSTEMPFDYDRSQTEIMNLPNGCGINFHKVLAYGLFIDAPLREKLYELRSKHPDVTAGGSLLLRDEQKGFVDGLKLKGVDEADYILNAIEIAELFDNFRLKRPDQVKKQKFTPARLGAIGRLTHRIGNSLVSGSKCPIFIGTLKDLLNP